MKLLLVEDEIKTAQVLKKGLEENHFTVDVAYDGQTGLHLISQNNYSVIISDVILPNISGIDLCSQIRAKGIETPILMLTALSSIDDKLTGFEVGADDYLAKPFEFKELLARIKSLAKRVPVAKSEENELRYSDIKLNTDSKLVFRSNVEIELTATEFALMKYFLLNKEKVVSKSDIAEKVWDINFDTGTNVVEVYVNYLRNKIDKKFPVKLLHTVHGMGYILKEK